EGIFRRYKELHANGMHVYLSHTSPHWPTRLVASPYREQGSSPLETFLADARAHGIGVWTTPAPPYYRIASADDPDFPAYYCPNSRWGRDWNAILADLARFDFAGISLVPDEYNYNNWALHEQFSKHSDPRVAEFYRKMPTYCDCPDCKRLFINMFGIELPDLRRIEPTEAYRDYVNFRYWTTTRWLKEAAETVKRVNPQCRADSLICVTPVCSDNWWGPGVAWDMVGYSTKIDYLTTDPYILLHNYLGDSTHWYVTETALKLSGASPKHVCGVVLEPCRLRQEHRELEPVEVYGSPLSAVFHGAREVFYFHWVHITGRSRVAQNAEATQRNVQAAYSLLEAIDPWLDGARPWPGIAVLHSRASEDWWAFYSQGEQGKSMLTRRDVDARYGFLAQLEPLMALLRCGVPTDLFYLDAVKPEELSAYPVVLVPFPYAVSDNAAELLEALARRGKRVVVISQCGRLTEDGRLRDRPALLSVLGLQAEPQGLKKWRPTQAEWASVSAGTTQAEEFTVYETVRPTPDTQVLVRSDGTPVVLKRHIGRGDIVFMAGEFGAGLPRDYSNWHRGRDRRVYPPVLREGHLRALTAALFDQPAPPADWPHVDPVPVPGEGDDVEVAYMLNAKGDLLILAINWRGEPAAVSLQVPKRFSRRPYNAQTITPQAGHSARLPKRDNLWDAAGRLRLSLAAQQVAVVRIPVR
ncbi:MAG: beta-galactosidase trimerization domain-containing protein, partial [Armatimonadetes bacterium]|nr:beta-galactosidase trimerization domain-containing protein [Armatimonadota bacterium]